MHYLIEIISLKGKMTLNTGTVLKDVIYKYSYM